MAPRRARVHAKRESYLSPNIHISVEPRVGSGYGASPLIVDQRMRLSSSSSAASGLDMSRSADFFAAAVFGGLSSSIETFGRIGSHGRPDFPPSRQRPDRASGRGDAGRLRHGRLKPGVA